jgi:tRNA wybutosine-synthesizing protein 2
LTPLLTMRKFYQRLRNELKTNTSISEQKLDLLPRRYQIIGKILLVKLEPSLSRHRKAIGKTILKILPYIKSVLWVKEIRGNKRLPSTEVIAGLKNCETMHNEHKCAYWLNPAKITFSKGNKFEKLRLLKQIKPTDTVVDMFAGIGYWSIPIAKHAKPRKIYAIDINPLSLRYLERNTYANKVAIEILEGDCKKFAPLLQNSANHVIMGYFDTIPYFQSALIIAKSGGIIHYHDKKHTNDILKLKNDLKTIAKKANATISFKTTKTVKSFAPGIKHIVMDIKVKKSNK